MNNLGFSVSVIIPTYNYAQFIAEAIKSVLNQSYPKEQIEIIVIDDGSVDHTEEVVLSLSAPNLRYIKQENMGKASATKVGIEQSTGKYIFNLDADDLFLPGKIEMTVKVFESNPDIVHVASPARFHQEPSGADFIEPVPDILFGTNDGLDVLSTFYKEKILFGGGSTFAARASVLKKIHVPPEVDMYIDEYLVLATLGKGCTYFFKQPLSVWRKHERNYSGNDDDDNFSLKAQRLINSSRGVLENLRSLGLPESFESIYTLQHKVREIALNERLGKKSIRDILRFLVFILSSKYSCRMLRKYSALNRLVPLGILKFVKLAAK